jgi:pyruvate,water dikinase
VVTDIGGPLSHSSIVAREYGIPAVLGTNVATRRITDGARIRVDGDAGTVTLLDEAGADPEVGGEPGPQRGGPPWPGLAVGGAVVAGVTAAVVALRRRRRAR